MIIFFIKSTIKYFSIIFLCFISFTCKSQLTGTAKYKVGWVVVSNYETIGYLNFTAVSAYFSNMNDSGAVNKIITTKAITIEEKLNLKNAPIKDGEPERVTTISKKEIINTQVEPFNIYSDLDNHKLVQEVKFKKGDDEIKNYLVTESIGIINWNLENEFKQIGKFNCQKAICLFRGRYYTAWFASEIPIMLGPWKLHGLPGIIVEAVDSENEVYFQLLSIELRNTKPVVNNIPSTGTEITLEEFANMASPISKQEANEMIRRVSSKLPKDSKLELGSFKISNTGIEKEYEFFK